MYRLALAAVLFALPVVATAQTAKEAFVQRARNILGPEYSALLAVNCSLRDLAWYSDVSKAVERAYSYAARQAGIPGPEIAEIRVTINEQLMPITNASDRTCPLLLMDSTLSDLDRLVLLNRRRP